MDSPTDTQPPPTPVGSDDLLAAVDALRGALGGNPCVLLSGDPKDRYYFSDPDLENAIRKIMPLLPR